MSGASSSDAKRTVLVTGSSGHVGRTVVHGLRAAGHAVHGLDRQPHGELAQETIGDIAEAGVWDAAFTHDAGAKIDTLIHLAAHPYHASDFLADLLEPNVVGMYQAFEAAARHGVSRMVFASTVQVVSGRGGSGGEALPISTELHRPTNMYAVTKCMAELMGRFYAGKRIGSVMAARIGWFVRDRGDRDAIVARPVEQRAMFVSHRDLSRFFVATVQAEHTGYGSYWCMSADGVSEVDAETASAGRFDLEAGRRDLHYWPQDKFPAGIDGSVSSPKAEVLT